MLQYLAYGFSEREKALYVTADHPWFYQNTLFDLASEWYKYNGKLLLIDEVHKYPNWSRELKLIYDGHPDLKIIFTSSSASDLYRGESDLSRRLVTQTLSDLSFREYLAFHHGLYFDKITLPELLKNVLTVSMELT
ncbi:MAG: ATP-binding protein, partial [Chitinophagaceae bacterium]